MTNLERELLEALREIVAAYSLASLCEGIHPNEQPSIVKAQQAIASASMNEAKAKPEPLLTVALAIELADRGRVPDGYADEFGIDHPDVSDWGVFLARNVLAALAKAEGSHD